MALVVLAVWSGSGVALRAGVVVRGSWAAGVGLVALGLAGSGLPAVAAPVPAAVAAVAVSGSGLAGSGLAGVVRVPVAVRVPGVPGGVGVVSGDARLIVLWSAAAGRGRAVLAYQVGDRVASSSGKWGSWRVVKVKASARSRSVAGANGSLRQVRVRAKNAKGWGAWSPAVTARVGLPGAPSGLGVVAGPERFDASWAAASGNGSPVTAYRVQSRSWVSGAWTSWVTRSTADRSLTWVGLVANRSYQVRVAAVNKWGQGPFSAAKTVVPTPVIAPPLDTIPPGSVIALTVGTRTTSSIQLSWTNPTDADLASIVVRRATGSAPPATVTSGTAVVLPSATATSLVDTGLTAGTQYSYAVFAQDAMPNSSGPVSVTTSTLDPVDTTAPGPVTALTVGTRTTSSIQLSWTNPTDADLASILVRRATGPTPPATVTAGTGVALASATATGVSDTGLTAGTQYSYAVFARDGVANTSIPVSVTTSTLAAPDTTAPGPVTSLTVGTRTTSSIQLSWINPTDADLASIVVRRATGSTPPATVSAGSGVALATATATSVTDTGLTPGVTYSYAVFARDAVPNTSTPMTTTTDTLSGCIPTIVHVSGTLTADTTWAPDCALAYVVDSSLTIPTGITLTITPGSVVKANANADITVQGSLTASGSVGAPVVFTSTKDDSVGGDATGDGSASAPAPGDWGGIRLSDVGVVSLTDAVLRYGGSIAGSGSVLSLRRVLVEYSASDGVNISGTGDVSVRDSRFQDIAGVGVRVVGTSSDIYNAHAVSGVVTVTDSTFTRGRYGVALSLVDRPTVMRNSFSAVGSSLVSRCTPWWTTGQCRDVRSVALQVSGNLDFSKLTGNSGAGNGLDAMMINGHVVSGGSWPSQSWPVVIGGRPVFDAYDLDYFDEGANLAGQLFIDPGVDVVIPSGTVIKSYKGVLTVQGSLTASGSVGAPVVFTSTKDDSVGGDATGDGSASAPAPGDWGGIRLSDVGVVSLTDAVLRYGGSIAGSGSVLSLRRVLVEYSASDGVNISGTGDVSVRDSRFQDIAGVGVRVVGTSSDIYNAHAVSGVVTVTDSTFTRGRYGVALLWLIDRR
ncbi:MAG: fibronectin type III domain-containing protein [Candidatus Nanopelagicales bacterium]